jgi:3-oxoadipate enol-lactonase
MTAAGPVTTIRIGPAPSIALDCAGEGELVLFLHGIGGNRTNWADQLPVFAAHFRAAAWDARGYGLSDDYAGPLHFPDFAADLARVLDRFEVAKAHLVGLSMGGLIALDFCRDHQDRVKTLCLVDTNTGLRQSLSPAQLDEFIRIRRDPLLQGKEPKDIAPIVAKTLIGPKAPPQVFQRLVDSMAALHKESYIKTVETATRYDGYPPLGAIKVPTLVLVGADDRLTPPSEAARIAEGIGGAALAVIPDAGHLSNIEQPSHFNRVLLDFLLAHRL